MSNTFNPNVVLLTPSQSSNKILTKIISQAKVRLLRMHFESSVGHIGGNLSSLDLLMVLYHKLLNEGDAFVLSKGHAAGAFYITLWSLGRLTDEDLQKFHQDGTKLSGHPPVGWMPEILFATGSLGHGLSLSNGLALAKKLKSESGRIFCLLSDGEWNEGSNWEALIFAVHQKLHQLTMIIDCNGLQGFGTTQEVANLEPLAEKFRAFGCAVTEINGHDLDAIREALSSTHKKPHVIIAHTKKGNGVSFMENKMEWHYLPMTPDQYQQALKEVGI
ncbi:MAG: transketolase [Nostoc sp.]|uniref:transketolase n=1 Tax=Nostoc sp. TaxID=1180 RepID=UPI002FF47413